MNRTQKERHVESLRRELEGITSAFLFGYQGLTVNQVTELRAKVRRSASRYRVLKNRLAARALEGTALSSLCNHLTGPLALAFHPREPVVVVKVLSEFAKENPALEFRAGLMEGRVLSSADLNVLAALPSREVLIGRLAGALTSPLAAFQRALMAPIRDFASVLEQIAKKKEEAG